MPGISAENRARMCQFTYADGRRCRLPRTSTGEGFCFNHSRKLRERRQLQQLLDYILEPLLHHTVSSTTLTFLLVRLYTAVAYGNIPAKTSNALLRIVESLRRTLPDTKQEFRNNFEPASLRKAIWNLYDEHADLLADFKNNDPSDSDRLPNNNADPAPFNSLAAKQDPPSAGLDSLPQAPVPLSDSEASAADLASTFTLKDVDALFQSLKNHHSKH